MPRLRRKLMHAALALLLVVPMVPRLALCVGTEGHSAIELLGAACCRSEQASLDGFCTSRCTDVPLGTVLAARRTDDGARGVAADHWSRGPVLPVGLSGATLLASFVSDRRRALRIASPPAPHLPSTVLRR